MKDGDHIYSLVTIMMMEAITPGGNWLGYRCLKLTSYNIKKSFIIKVRNFATASTIIEISQSFLLSALERNL